VPATPNQLRIIRRAALGGAAVGLLYAAVAIVATFSKNAVSGVILAVSLPIYLFLPVGAGAILGCLVGWVYCWALRKK
jgi:hypothetical protein